MQALQLLWTIGFLTLLRSDLVDPSGKKILCGHISLFLWVHNLLDDLEVLAFSH
jgi:hypothetical protein